MSASHINVSVYSVIYGDCDLSLSVAPAVTLILDVTLTLIVALPVTLNYTIKLKNK
eukprot:SAG31_NODE_15450_length_754_cov_1.251908_1_plen_56_part_00